MAKFGAELKKALDASAIKEKLAALGVEAMPLTAAQFDAQVKQEVMTYGAFAKAAGLKGN